MELRKIQKSDYRDIKVIYTGAFPHDERVPFRLLRKRAEQGRADFWIISEKGKNIGLVYLVTYKDLAYLFYYAIDSSYRGKGYGTKAMKAIIEMYKKYRLFLALEDCKEESKNEMQRIKRHDFYLNCGLHDLPYKLKEATVIFFIMGIGIIGISVIPGIVYGILICVIAAFPMALLGIIPQSIVADVAEADSYATGENREGMFFAARTFAMKFGQSVMILQLLYLV